MDDGWIECDGEQPVSDTLMVEVKFRNGVIDRDRAGCWYWLHDGDDCDIVAYRSAEA